MTASSSNYAERASALQLEEWPTVALSALHKLIGGMLADRALGNTRDDAIRRMHEAVEKEQKALPF